jgi:kynurenine formamidase
MRIIDLTYTIAEDMPVYPGTETPKLQITNTYEQNGFKETLLTMFSHTGTHMDAPAHLFADKMTLDHFHVQQFIGTAFVIDCTALSGGDIITMDYINKDRVQADKAEFLLFMTGWGKYWGTEQYFGDYPYIDKEVAQYIIRTHKKGVGLDTIGIDPVADVNLTTHKNLFAKNEMVIIENLTHLEQIGTDIFTFFALPLKYENSDGAPVRAIAVLGDCV